MPSKEEGAQKLTAMANDLGDAGSLLAQAYEKLEVFRERHKDVLKGPLSHTDDIIVEATKDIHAAGSAMVRVYLSMLMILQMYDSGVGQSKDGEDKDDGRQMFWNIN